MGYTVWAFHLFQSSSLKKLQATGHRRENRMYALYHLVSLKYSYLPLIFCSLFHSVRVRHGLRSHDINEELTGVSHGHAERLA